jgi:hypothetical protein
MAATLMAATLHRSLAARNGQPSTLPPATFNVPHSFASPHISYAIVLQNCLVTTWLTKRNERLINHFGTHGSLAV